jgi:hypothetical protein
LTITKIMAGQLSKKRKAVDLLKNKKTKRPAKKIKKQTEYHSDSSDEEGQDFQAVNLQDSDEGEEGHRGSPIQAATSGDEDSDLLAANPHSEVTGDSNSDSDSEEDSDPQSNPNLTRKRKRNDPEAFATSMSKILGSRLSTSKRNDPVLSRSVTALKASKEITDQTLEKKARHKLREERRAALDKGRVKDVLGASTAFDAARGDVTGVPSTAETMELEKRLRKTAQRGVVKLFNAVRAAQIKGEEAAKEARKKGLVGYGRREEKVNEMSKKGFLELIAGGGGGLKSQVVEEA